VHNDIARRFDPDLVLRLAQFHPFPEDEELGDHLDALLVGIETGRAIFENEILYRIIKLFDRPEEGRRVLHFRLDGDCAEEINLLEGKTGLSSLGVEEEPGEFTAAEPAEHKKNEEKK
jgi:hypothetical protein